MSIKYTGTKELPREADWERTVRDAVRSPRFGSVEVLVHDGRVVQVETREKVRFAERPADPRERPGAVPSEEEGGA